MNRLDFLLCLFGIISTVLINNATSIVDGDYATPNQFKYQVFIESEKGRKCSGGIIDDLYVLSAADCFVNSYGSFYDDSYSIVADTSEPAEIAGIFSEVDSVCVPFDSRQKWTGKYPNNIAVVKLKKSLDLANKPHLSKLRLPSRNETYFGKQGVLAGYGFNYKNGVVHNESINKLNYGYADETNSNIYKFVIDSQRQIEGFLDKWLHIPDDQNCDGDNGSPLVIDNDLVIGIVNAPSIPCYNAHTPNIYARVSHYKRFIDEVVGGNCPYYGLSKSYFNNIINFIG